MTEKDKQEIIDLLKGRKDNAQTAVKGINLIQIALGVVGTLSTAAILAGITLWSDVRDIKKNKPQRSELNHLRTQIEVYAGRLQNNFKEIEEHMEECPNIRNMNLYNVSELPVITRGATVDNTRFIIPFGQYVPDLISKTKK